MINGHVYTAEDCGGAVKGNVIDISPPVLKTLHIPQKYLRKENNHDKRTILGEVYAT